VGTVIDLPDGGCDHHAMLGPTITAAYAQHVLRAAETLGVDTRRLLRESGLDPEQLEDPDARVSVQAHGILWQRVCADVGRENFGIVAGRTFTPSSLGITGLAMSLLESPQDAFSMLDRYRTLIGPRIAPHFEIQKDVMVARFAPFAPAFVEATHCDDTGLIAVMRWSRVLSDILWKPTEVWFQHKRPTDIRPYEEFFPCRMRFAQPYACLIFPREYLEARIQRTDHGHLSYLSRRAEMLLGRLQANRSVADLVRERVEHELEKGGLDESRIARQLGMSTRTLQRRLRGEGLSFAKILDDVRRRLAFSHLQNQAFPISEVAFRLGYSEPTAFFRAFRRWSGTTPQRARLYLSSTGGDG
jgi:AraC-like DNA-binding protein